MTPKLSVERIGMVLNALGEFRNRKMVGRRARTIVRWPCAARGYCLARVVGHMPREGYLVIGPTPRR